jgi:8-oxo-dGTP pyrophosphatase MutT (NUDIX family)
LAGEADGAYHLRMSVSPPSPASTIVLLRAGGSGPPEVLLMQRHARASWLSGAWVFPGGRVDDGDRVPIWGDLSLGARAVYEAWPQADPAWLRDHAVAALRELFEETGLLLADTVVDVRQGQDIVRPGVRHTADERRRLLEGLASFASLCDRRRWRIRLDRLVPFVRWITPESEKRRFDTVFFACESEGTSPEMHDDELSAHAWITAADAVERFDRGEMAMAPPTLRTLEDLAGFQSLHGALDWVRTVPRLVLAPRLVDVDGEKLLVMPGDPLYPPGPGPGTPTDGPVRFVFDQGRWKSAR